MKLIVGLGNPGRKYAGTRHNIGFEVVAELARRHATSKPKHRFQGEAVEATIGDEKALLLCPSTFMNNSGSCVQPAQEFYKLDLKDLLVVCDDFNLDLAKLRFRTKGSSGGQKGLGDIIQRLGTDEVPRLRIGIGAPPENWDVADYVLCKFKKDEIAVMQQMVVDAADAVANWTRHDIHYCMNHYNANPEPRTDEGKKTSP